VPICESAPLQSCERTEKPVGRSTSILDADTRFRPAERKLPSRFAARGEVRQWHL
jgi:hypothetical protein